MDKEQVLVNGLPVQYERAPSNLQGSLQRYIESGIEPGSFLTAFLSNDLMGAAGRADHINSRQFPEIAVWLYNYAPPMSFGSPERVAAWVRDRQAVVVHYHKVSADA